MVFYFVFLFIVVYCPDFYSFWVVMECSSLLFMGLAYSFMSFGFSNIMLYFVIQALSSVNIFVFYSLSFDRLILFFLFLKLAVFPFFGWFMLVVSKLSNSLFLFISTFQKFPRILLFHRFLSSYSSFFFMCCLLLTVFTSSLFMFNSPRFRLLLSFSSVGRNSWFLFSSLSRLDFFYIFFVLYTLNFLIVLSFIGSSFKLSPSLSFGSLLVFFSLVISLAGFPPFPVFFIKLYILYSLSFYSYFSFGVVFLFLVAVVYMLSSYMRFSLSYFINLFSSPVGFII